MTIEISFEHYSGVITVEGRSAVLTMEQGRWYVTDTNSNQLMPPFLKKDKIDAITTVAKFLRDNKS